jgi:hypothetical protein
LKLELEKTLLEFSSALAIIKLLQEEGNLKGSGCERTSGCILYHEETPAQIERKESKWVQVITGQHKRSRKPEIKHAQPVLMSVNQYELLNNLKESTNVTQNWWQESSEGIEDRRRGDLVRKKHEVIIIGDSHVRRCATEITHNLGETFEVTGFVKPDTRLEVITNMANKEIDKLMREDVVVV